MNYRKFGKTGLDVSALGFGAMRLPLKGESSAQIDEEKANEMLYYAIEQGVNYVDTAYPYHQGESERWLGRAMKGGVRQKIHLATKLPSWLVKTAGDMDRLLDEQLGKLQTDWIDFYLLHALNKNSWTNLRDLDVLKWAEGAVASGRIRHIGFSFHDKQDVFLEIVDAYDRWDFCQIQYNYMDIEEQAGLKGLQYASSKGMAVVIMEPLRGGQLTRKPPVPVQQIWDTAAEQRSPADWALQWLWDQPEVSLTLSGMSTLAQVKENVASAERSGVGSLSGNEREIVSQAREEFKKLALIPCTRCEYCLPCPNGVAIPRNFWTFNDGFMYDDVQNARSSYKNWIKESERAENCIQCQECESKCPQGIRISDWMPVVDDVLGKGQAYRSLN